MTERALLKRINRRLAKEGERVSKGRDGKFYCVDVLSNALLAETDDLKAWGREVGALAATEADSEESC